MLCLYFHGRGQRLWIAPKHLYIYAILHGATSQKTERGPLLRASVIALQQWTPNAELACASLSPPDDLISQRERNVSARLMCGPWKPIKAHGPTQLRTQ
jgi:hypothetical protein